MTLGVNPSVRNEAICHTAVDTFALLTCVDLTDDQMAVLAAIGTHQCVPEYLEPVLDELRRWGWVMPNTLELTGTGRRHVENARSGLLG